MKRVNLPFLKKKLIAKKTSKNLFKQTSIQKPHNLKKKNFKLKKKWRHWRLFKLYYINKKKITFFKKLQWSFNNVRIIKHQLIKSYLPNKNKNLFKYTKKIGHSKFFSFLRKLELRLGILLLRTRFFHKLINCYTAIKLNLILINGIIINATNYIVHPLDLILKRRLLKITNKKLFKRKLRLKWRKVRWKQARFIFWKIRRASHFNMYWIRKQNTTLNYLEINYKIPGFVLLKQPFLKELLLNKEPKLSSYLILKKIYFLY